jgi:hypothetical protein
MENILSNIIELIIILSLTFSVHRYWRIRIYEYHALSAKNISYAIFAIFQLLAISIIYLSSIDSQTNIYLEEYLNSGEGNINRMQYYGVQLYGFILVYVAAYILSLYITQKTFGKSFKVTAVSDSIKNDEWVWVLVFSAFQVILSFLVGSMLLKAFLFYMISADAYFPLT